VRDLICDDNQVSIMSVHSCVNWPYQAMKPTPRPSVL